MLSWGVLLGQESTPRPQDPVKPYPYTSEEVSFVNEQADHISLAGTLTLPKHIKNPPVVILITGSGQQNRNSEIFNHRPFLVLSDYLTRHGIAVLRYDDRGVEDSEGTFQQATSKDFSADVEAAISFLMKRTDIDTEKIGLIGHSEGGFIAPMVASNSKDVAFVISLAGTGVIGEKVLISQTKKMFELIGFSSEYIEIDLRSRELIFSVIKEETDAVTIVAKSKEKLQQYAETLEADKKILFSQVQSDKIIDVFSKSKWLQYFVKTDPDQFLSKVTVPVLAIYGSKDIQVLSSLNLEGFRSSLEKAGNKDVTIKNIDGLNHLFQKAETGAISEYENIDETFNLEVMVLIKNWILKRF